MMNTAQHHIGRKEPDSAGKRPAKRPTNLFRRLTSNQKALENKGSKREFNKKNRVDNLQQDSSKHEREKQASIIQIDKTIGERKRVMELKDQIICVKDKIMEMQDKTIYELENSIAELLDEITKQCHEKVDMIKETRNALKKKEELVCKQVEKNEILKLEISRHQKENDNQRREYDELVSGLKEEIERVRKMKENDKKLQLEVISRQQAENENQRRRYEKLVNKLREEIEKVRKLEGATILSELHKSQKAVKTPPSINGDRKIRPTLQGGSRTMSEQQYVNRANVQLPPISSSRKEHIRERTNAYPQERVNHMCYPSTNAQKERDRYGTCNLEILEGVMSSVRKNHRDDNQGLPRRVRSRMEEPPTDRTNMPPQHYIYPPSQFQVQYEDPAYRTMGGSNMTTRRSRPVHSPPNLPETYYFQSPYSGMSARYDHYPHPAHAAAHSRAVRGHPDYNPH